MAPDVAPVGTATAVPLAIVEVPKVVVLVVETELPVPVADLLTVAVAALQVGAVNPVQLPKAGNVQGVSWDEETRARRRRTRLAARIAVRGRLAAVARARAAETDVAPKPDHQRVSLEQAGEIAYLFPATPPQVPSRVSTLRAQ